MSGKTRTLLILLVIALTAICIVNASHPEVWAKVGIVMGDAGKDAGNFANSSVNFVAGFFKDEPPEVAPTVACAAGDDLSAFDDNLKIRQGAGGFYLRLPVGCQAKKVRLPDRLFSIDSRETDGRFEWHFPPNPPSNWPVQSRMWYSFKNLEKYPVTIHLKFTYY